MNGWTGKRAARCSMPAPSPLAPFLEFLREGGSDKHARDIRFILAATTVDLAFVETEVTRLGLHEQWRRCQSAG